MKEEIRMIVNDYAEEMRQIHNKLAMQMIIGKSKQIIYVKKFEKSTEIEQTIIQFIRAEVEMNKIEERVHQKKEDIEQIKWQEIMDIREETERMKN